jgi:hypothetical protein
MPSICLYPCRVVLDSGSSVNATRPEVTAYYGSRF